MCINFYKCTTQSTLIITSNHCTVFMIVVLYLQDHISQTVALYKYNIFISISFPISKIKFYLYCNSLLCVFKCVCGQYILNGFCIHFFIFLCNSTGSGTHRSFSRSLFSFFHRSLKSEENSTHTEKNVFGETSFSSPLGLTEKNALSSRKLENIQKALQLKKKT